MKKNDPYNKISHPTKISHNPGKIVAYIFLCLFILLILYLLMEYISMRLKYKPLFDWWAQNGGNQYNNLFKIMAMVSAKNSALLFYIVNYILTPPLAQATRAGLTFILKDLIPLSTYISDGKFEGVVTPRSLCESVLPKYGGHDVDFNTALDSKKITRGTHPVDPTKTTGLLYITLTQAFTTGTMKGKTIISYVFDETCLSKENKAPLWPSKGDQQSWAGLIFEWLNGTDSTKNKTHIKAGGSCTPTDATSCPPDPDASATKISWYVTMDANDNHKQFIENTSTTYYNGKPPNKYLNWFGPIIKDKPSKPPADNWMARMSINWNSPLIVGFINNEYSIGTVIMNPKAFENLIGTTGGVAGGWLGFIQGSPQSADMYDDIIRSTVEFTPSSAPPPCKPNWIGGISAGFAPIAAGAGMYAMMAAAAPVTWPALIAIAGGSLLSGILGGINAGTC